MRKLKIKKDKIILKQPKIEDLIMFYSKKIRFYFSMMLLNIEELGLIVGGDISKGFRINVIRDKINKNKFFLDKLAKSKNKILFEKYNGAYAFDYLNTSEVIKYFYKTEYCNKVMGLNEIYFEKINFENENKNFFKCLNKLKIGYREYYKNDTQDFKHVLEIFFRLLLSIVNLQKIVYENKITMDRYSKTFFTKFNTMGDDFMTQFTGTEKWAKIHS